MVQTEHFYYQQKSHKTSNEQWLSQNWFNLVILLLAAYLFFNKEVSFTIGTQAPPSAIAAKLPVATTASFKNTSNATTKPNNKGQAIPKTIATTPVSRSKPKSSTKTKGVKAANTFSNISAIMVSNFAKKYAITEAEVKTRKQTCEKYVKRFSAVAKAEMKKYGIPASITLAQGLLESDAGGSRLSNANNNHFGIKCFSKHCKKGHCANFSDDTHKDFFRKYDTSWASFRAHSKLLQGKRYKKLKQLGTKNYRAWARGLQKAGYATDKRYADKLILIIEKMKLYEYDN